MQTLYPIPWSVIDIPIAGYTTYMYVKRTNLVIISSHKAAFFSHNESLYYYADIQIL